jgi:hypothetical protein
MYTGSRIVELLGKDQEAYVLTEDSWIREQRGKVLCDYCAKRRPQVYPAPIDIPIRQLPKGTTYDGVHYGGVGIIHVRLLEFLQPHLRGHVLGQCLWWKDHSIMPDYRSIYMPPGVIIRGDRRTDYYVCSWCGAISTVSFEPYVLRNELEDAEVFQDAIDCLYLGEDLARKLPWSKFTDVKPFVIPVRDEPLPDDPFPGARQQ